MVRPLRDPSHRPSRDRSMSSTENTSPPESPSPSPEREPQGNGAAGAAEPSVTTEARSAEGEAEAHGDAEGGEAESGEGHAATGEAGAPGAAKKRRRRRRKKPGAGAAGATAPGQGAEGEAEGGTDGADAAPGAEGDGANRPAGARPKGRKPERKDRAPHAFPRERPAFGVGDVVFGKIIEITDDAVFVDLSGKARGIFDRLEMDLPDEPAEEPGAVHEEDAADEDEESTDEAGEAAAAEGTTPLEASGEAAPQASEASTTAHAQAEEARRARRIVVAAAAKALEADAAAQPEGAPTDPGAPVEGADAGAAASPAPAHRTAPYAPPIVLELGAHFVGLVHNDGARGGLIVLTRHPRRLRAAKLLASAAFRDKTLVSGLVTGTVRGGVEVDIDGLRAFAPGSHVDLRPGSDLRHLVGRRLQFLVTQYAKRGRDVVLSRRPMLDSEAKAQRTLALERVQVGAVVSAVVKSVVSFGAFLDIGGVEGLVTLQEMSHNRGDAPHDVFRAGETVEVRVIRMDEKGKIWLSRKSAIPDPWDDAMKKYAVGTRHAGKVVRLQPFGAFVELEPGIDGLIHVGDLSVKPVEHPSDVVKVGDAIDVIVAQADPVSHKIGLHPAPTGAAADEAPQRVQLHKPVKVQVMAVEPGGLVVRILGATGRHARGYITSMATGTPRGTELRKPFPVGTTLDAKVIEMDPRRGEIKLSIKALHDDSERNAYQQYRQQVTREAKFGTFGDLLSKKDAPK